ncbi:MAG: hypothetical protein ACI8P0_005499 [Planctomycetaceae bacterium]|jgi:hypothetical protein
MADGADVVAAQMVGLKERFAELPDPRSTINRRHLLVDVVAISVCGVLAGADGRTGGRADGPTGRRRFSRGPIVRKTG